MKNLLNIDKVNIYKKDILIGELYRTRDGCKFIYDDDYLLNVDTSLPENGLSYTMPATSVVYSNRGYNLPPFFAGLLPEGLRLQSIISLVKTSADEMFSILLAVGNDCIGDISAGLTYETNQGISEQSELQQVSFPELFEKSISGSKSDRNFSIPGIQEKISSNMISFPLQMRNKKKQFILKIANPNFPQIIENEHFFMQFASASGIKTAKTRLVYDRNQISGLLIERFDRSYDSNTKTFLKHHQEDICQLLNMYPADKYRIGCSKIAECLQKFATSPTLIIADFIKLKCFSYLIANGDLHAKNISLLEKDGVIQLSPAYDLLSTLPYGDKSMALELNGRKDNLKYQDFISYASRYDLNIKIADKILTNLYEHSGNLITKISDIGLADKKTVYLTKVIQKRRQDLIAGRTA